MVTGDWRERGFGPQGVALGPEGCSPFRAEGCYCEAFQMDAVNARFAEDMTPEEMDALIEEL